MPDQPGKGPPSSAPLSVEDADRLAESFTPFWEDDDAPAPVPTALAPVAAAHAPAPVAAAHAPALPVSSPSERGPESAVTVPLATKVTKHTLLGMAPLFAAPGAPVTPSAARPAQAPKDINSQPVPNSAPSPSAGPGLQPAPSANASHKKTLLGFSAPVVQPPGPAPAPVAAAAPSWTKTDPTSTPIIQGAANVPGYAIAYTPKDGPATPAVVIAPEAQSSPEAAERPLSQTQPSKVRVVPIVSAPAARAGSTLDDPDDMYPAKKKTGKVVAGVLGALVVLLAAAFVIRATSGSSSTEARAGAPAPPAATPAPPPAAEAPTPAVTGAAPAITAPVVPTPTAEPTRPVPQAHAPESTPARSVHAPAGAKPAKPRPEPAAAPAPRPAPRPVAAASFPSETSAPAPKAVPAKSVIVRDAPF